MGTMLSDVRFAVRSLVRRPLFAATAIVTLALGIGANASIFTISNGILFTPFPLFIKFENDLQVVKTGLCLTICFCPNFFIPDRLQDLFGLFWIVPESRFPGELLFLFD